MTLRPSHRITQVQSPMIAVVGEMVRRHPGTISLGQGVVHYGSPQAVRDAAAKALADGSAIDRYGLAFGNDALLDAIRAKLVSENGIVVGGDRRVVVTAGSNMGFQSAVLAVGDAGDEIIILSPYYFNHEMAIRIAGCEPVIVATDAEYQPDLAAIAAAISSRTRAIVTISPNNPTGAVYSRESLSATNQLCNERGIYHIHDEAYECFAYSRKHWSPGSSDASKPHTISLFTFSKAFGMAGWRVGYMLIPASLEASIKKIQDTNLICPPMLNQIAATVALSAGSGWYAPRIAEIARVRDLVIEQLRSLGDRIDCPTPQGAFYALARYRSKIAEMSLIERLIAEFGVAVMPGSTFGAPGSLRIAYGALDGKSVAEGMGRLVRGLNALL